MTNSPLEADGILLLHNSLYPRPFDLDESVRAFERNSRFPVFSIDISLGYPPNLDRIRFQVVVLHYTMFYTEFEPLSDRVRTFLSNASDAFKVVLFQDEQAYLRERLDFCLQYGIDCIYTCLEPPYADQVYGPTGASTVISYLPGYVSDRLRTTARKLTKPDEDRPIDVGYRGRKPPRSWGGAASEKYEIAAEFKRRAHGLGLVLDIETEEEKRIYGRSWPRFIARCKGMLGTESGATILGPDGSENPYRTISPRHFEAAALHACQILFEGRYSGLMEPMQDYIPLRKDFSNFDEVIDAFRDSDVRRRLSSNAFRHLISSGEWSYTRFVRQFDETLIAAGVDPNAGRTNQSEVARALYPPKARRVARRSWTELRARARLARSRLRDRSS